MKIQSYINFISLNKHITQFTRTGVICGMIRVGFSYIRINYTEFCENGAWTLQDYPKPFILSQKAVAKREYLKNKQIVYKCIKINNSERIILIFYR